MARKQRAAKGRIQRPRIDISKKLGSLAFFLAIPTELVVSGLSVYTLVKILQTKTTLSPEVLIITASSFIGTIGIITSTRMPWLRTFIHELKHVAMIRLTGNEFTDFHVDRKTGETGYVSFKIYEDKTHFGPFISLAPYFFPLFSLPTLIAAIVFEPYSPYLFAFLLGTTLALDLLMGLHDLHPQQTDIQQILGGRFPAYLFAGSFHLMWFLLCAIWAVGTREGYLEFGRVVADFVTACAALFS